MAKLDDPLLRDRVVTAVTDGMTTRQAAAHCGVSATAIGNYSSKNEEFRVEMDAARARRSVVAHHAPRMMPAPANPPMGDPGETITPYDDPCSPAGRARLYEMLWRHADDGGSKGCPKSLDVLAQLGFAPELLAIQAKAKREAAELERGGEVSPMRTQLVIVKQGDRRVVDAEVVEREPRSGS